MTSRLATHFRVTPQRLMSLLLGACCIGILLPLYTVFSKHYIFGSGTFRYYGGYTAFNVLALILLIRRRKWIEQKLSVCTDWLHEPSEVYARRSEEHTSELQSRRNLVCRLLLEKKKSASPPPPLPPPLSHPTPII